MTATLYPGRSTHRAVGSAVPNYALRRAVALVLGLVLVTLAILACAGLVGVVVDFGGRPAAASEIEPSAMGGSSSPIVRIHVAQAGDTLWSIADTYRGDVGRDRYIDTLIDLNGGTSLQVGEAVRLP
jgi:hypothetical protein